MHSWHYVYINDIHSMEKTIPSQYDVLWFWHWEILTVMGLTWNLLLYDWYDMIWYIMQFNAMQCNALQYTHLKQCIQCDMTFVKEFVNRNLRWMIDSRSPFFIFSYIYEKIIITTFYILEINTTSTYSRTDQATCHYLDQYWLDSLTQIYVWY